METPTNEDVLRIMIEGGERLCDESVRKWNDPEYYDLGRKTKTAHLLWWSAARR